MCVNNSLVTTGKNLVLDQIIIIRRSEGFDKKVFIFSHYEYHKKKKVLRLLTKKYISFVETTHFLVYERGKCRTFFY